MRGLRIAVDVDGTLAEHDEPLCRLLREQYDVEIYPEDLRVWGQPLDGVDHDWGSAIHEFWDHPEYLPAMDPIPGSVEAVREWHDRGATIVIATHRPEEVCDATEAWLNANAIPYDEYICGASWDKSEADCDILIDDAPHNMHAVADAGQHGVISLRYFNFDKVPDRDSVHDASDVLPHSRLALAQRPERQWEGIRELVETIARDFTADQSEEEVRNQQQRRPADH